MDRKSYDNKAMCMFDTIGSYFVDVLYNNHYRIAKDLVRRGVANNITDAYRGTIINYMNGSSRDELFKLIVHKLHEFYQKNSGFGSILLSEFQNKVLSQFIPTEYYHDFADRHKDKTLKEIVVRTVNEFGEAVLSTDMLRRIIDDHLNRDNVNLLQDRIVDIFILQREEYYTKFAHEISRKNAGSTVDKEVLNKLKNAYMDEKKKCCELVADKERAANIIRQLLDKISVMDTEIAGLRAELKAAQHMPSDENRGRERRLIEERPKLRDRREKTPYPNISGDEEIHKRQREIIQQRAEMRQESVRPPPEPAVEVLKEIQADAIVFSDPIVPNPIISNPIASDTIVSSVLDTTEKIYTLDDDPWLH